MGIGLGGIFAGFLIELWGWQMAFIVPAILTLVAGGFLGYHILIKKLPLQNSSDWSLLFFSLGIHLFVGFSNDAKKLEIRFTDNLRFQWADWLAIKRPCFCFFADKLFSLLLNQNSGVGFCQIVPKKSCKNTTQAKKSLELLITPKIPLIPKARPFFFQKFH